MEPSSIITGKKPLAKTAGYNIKADCKPAEVVEKCNLYLKKIQQIEEAPGMWIPPVQVQEPMFGLNCGI